MTSTRYRSLLQLTITAVAGFAAARAGQADVFVLRNGARLQGEWKNATEAGGRSYWIRTESGVEVHVPGSQVVEHVREPSSVVEYEQVSPTFADTVAEQQRLAEWCRQRGLVKQRREHLRRVVELDPRVCEAWQALGYTEIDGKWVTQKDFFQERGYVYYRGRWRLPQHGVTLPLR